VKRSGRDEPMWVAIHMCTEAMLRISLYSYPYLKLAKVLCLFLLFVMFSLQKIGENGGTGSAWRLGVEGVEVAKTMYTHVSK
jgi:hypothetical protein